VEVEETVAGDVEPRVFAVWIVRTLSDAGVLVELPGCEESVGVLVRPQASRIEQSEDLRGLAHRVAVGDVLRCAEVREMRGRVVDGGITQS
jgi:hypothetical protein